MQKIVMDKKQRVIAIVLGIVVIILIWQVIGLFSSNNTPAPAVHPANKVATPAMTGTAVTTNVPAPTSSAITATASDNENISPYQKKYLALLEEYKMVELQKQIAADKQAIAASQAATVEALNKINQLGGVADLQTVDATSADTASASSTQKADSSGAYSLVYTGLQDNDWTGTIKQGKSTYDVMIGTVLNGKEKVIDINNDEVVLQDKDCTTHLTFDGNTVTPNTAPKTAPADTTSIAKPAGQPIAQGIVQTPVLPHPKNVPSAINAQPMLATVNSTPAKHIAIPATTPTVSSATQTSWVQKIIDEVKKYFPSKPATTATMIPVKTTTSAPSLPAIPPMQPKPAVKTPVAAPTTGSTASAAMSIPAKPITITAAATPVVTTAATNTLANLNPNEFTIQLGMLSSSEELQSFISNLKLTENFYTYHEKGSRGRYGVVYGNFPTREAANAALKKLPASWKKSGPYIQQISTIQQLQAST